MRLTDEEKAILRELDVYGKEVGDELRLERDLGFVEGTPIEVNGDTPEEDPMAILTFGERWPEVRAAMRTAPKVEQTFTVTSVVPPTRSKRPPPGLSFVGLTNVRFTRRPK